MTKKAKSTEQERDRLASMWLLDHAPLFFLSFSTIPIFREEEEEEQVEEINTRRVYLN